jgi:C-terminal processing protease CtpA/Prc
MFKKGSTMHRTVLALMAGLTLLAWSVTLPAQSAPKLTAAQREQLAKLSAADYTTRQKTTRQLMAGQTLDNPTLRAMLQATDSPEAKHRVLAVAKHQTLRQYVRQTYQGPQPGAVGVSHQPIPENMRGDDEPPAVLVVATIAGFPGHAHLEAGDKLLAINGQPFEQAGSAAELPQRIKAYQRGEVITATINRNGQKQEVQFALAGAQALAAAHDPDTGRLSDAFRDAWLNRRTKLLEGLTLMRAFQLKDD